MENVNFQDYLKFLKKYLYLLILFPALIFLSVYLLTNLVIPAKYTTNSQLVVKLNRNLPSDLEMIKASIQLIPTFSAVIQSDEVRAEVAEILERGVDDQLTVQTKEDSVLVTITLIGTNQKEVEVSANTFTKVIIRKFAEIFENNEIFVLQTASPAVEVSHLFQYILSILTGELAALSFILYLFLSNPIIFDAHNIQEMNLTYLGAIPFVKRGSKIRKNQENFILKQLASKATLDKEVRFLDEKMKLIPFLLERQSEFSQKGYIYAVTSPNKGEGKSIAAFNLAKNFSEAGYKTVIIDFNVKSPDLTRTLKRSKKRGVSDYLLLNNKKINLLKYVGKTQFENLFFLSIGKSSKGLQRIYQANELQQLLTSLEEKFSIVIIDTPAVPVDNIAKMTSYLADEVIMTAMSGKTRKKELAEAIKSIEQMKQDQTTISMLLNGKKYSRKEKNRTIIRSKRNFNEYEI